MANVNALIAQRLKKGDRSPKMASLAQQSAAGQLTSFSGIFGTAELTENERDLLERLLMEYALDEGGISQDLESLVSITSEVKAINNQAILLHGERIKKAHGILTRYRDGAFTTWLLAAYGNRQTPYNFLQYYEFYESLPKALRSKADAMPRQAIYTLASRSGPDEKKQSLIAAYDGETKTEVLKQIRELFPLDTDDKRREDVGEAAIKTLSRLYNTLQGHADELTKQQRRALQQLLEQLQSVL